jgi:hypothetical protein
MVWLGQVVSALRDDNPGTDTALRRSIIVEGAAVALIFLLTALIITATMVPVNLQSAMSPQASRDSDPIDRKKLI